MILPHQRDCLHAWVAGMMYVHVEDLEEVSKHRKVECEECDLVYVSGEHALLWD